jgi:hypothetical protein
MTLAFLFWLLFILYILFGGFLGSRSPAPDRPFYYGNYGLMLVLIFLLGWKVFGFPIQG